MTPPPMDGGVYVTRIESMLISLVFIAFILLLYLLPTYLAFRHRNRDRWIILILNIWLGWTFVFWLVLIVWALATAEI